MLEVVKVCKESMPAVRLAGKRYTERDRDESGTFARYWQAFHREGWFDLLLSCETIPGVSADYLGVMRETGEADAFEYWIGVFLAPGAQVPHGFQFADIPAGEIGVCWLRGQDATGELYGMEASKLSMAALSGEGWKFSPNGWFMERYNCPRFTAPDKDGNVILDICAYLAE